jgi:phytoene dehydrogenase-like protein
MAKKSYDAIIIGGGCMGLCLGAYLQRSGMETAIFERRHEEGSAIFTSECTAPGFLHNLHAQYMEFMDWMPFYKDFELEKLGARYLYPEAQAGIAFSDGRPPIVMYSIEKPEHFELTRKSIAQYSKSDADTFIDLMQKVVSMSPFLAAGL